MTNRLTRWITDHVLGRLELPDESTEGLQEAQEANQRATETLARTRKRTPEFVEYGNAARQQREQNHFGARLAASYGLKESPR